MEGEGQGVTEEEQEVTKDQEVEEDHACPGAEVLHQKEMEMMMYTHSTLQVSLRKGRFPANSNLCMKMTPSKLSGKSSSELIALAPDWSKIERKYV